MILETRTTKLFDLAVGGNLLRLTSGALSLSRIPEMDD